MAQDISEVNHCFRYLDPNREDLFNWLINVPLKPQQSKNRCAQQLLHRKDCGKRNGGKDRHNGNACASA